MAKGREKAARTFTIQRYAERNWQNYEAMVNEVARLSAQLEEKRGNSELQQALISQARALTDAAKDLRASHANQAAAFDSIMEDLERAVSESNFPAMRSAAKALQGVLATKRELFLQANQKVASAFDALGAVKK